MKKSKFFIISFISIFTFFHLKTQIKDIVKWEYELKWEKDSIIKLILKGNPSKNWYVYTTKDKLYPLSLKFEKKDAYYIPIGKIEEIPESKSYYDSILESTRHIQKEKFTLTQKIKILSFNNFDINVELEYQGCFSSGACALENKKLKIPLKFDTLKQIANLSYETIKEEDTLDITKKLSISKTSLDKIEHKKTKYSINNLLIFFVISFLGGLAALVTPCVFPMIPITVSFFLKNSENKRLALTRASIYGLSIIFIFTFIGIVFSLLFGANTGNVLSTHWISNSIFFILLIVISASLFGVFEINLPSSIVNATNKQSNNSNIFISTFFMALTLVLVSFSCTGPIIGVLLVKASMGQLLEPLIGMLGFSIAFALPFTLLAYFPSLLNKIPKSGAWMTDIKISLGFIVLAFSLKFLNNINEVYNLNFLSRELFISFWIVIFTLLGLHLLKIVNFSHYSFDNKNVSFFRLILSIITFAFVVYLIPGLFGAPLKLISGFLPSLKTQEFNLSKYSQNLNKEQHFDNICDKPKYSEAIKSPINLNVYFDINQAIKCAKQKNKPLFITFTGHACPNCHKIETNIINQQEVLNRLSSNFIPVFLFVDDKTNLPKEEIYISKITNKTIKTLGEKNLDYLITKLNTNTIPSFLITDLEENTISNIIGSKIQLNDFINFLDSAYEKFKSLEKNT